jgi:hypothetical protein
MWRNVGSNSTSPLSQVSLTLNSSSRNAGSSLVRNSYTKFHKNPTNVSVADGRSQTDGRGLQKACMFLINEENLKLGFVSNNKTVTYSQKL